MKLNDSAGKPRLPGTSDEPPGSPLEYALRYAALGWSVFPCHSVKKDKKCTCGSPKCKSPGKHPLTSTGVNSATTDIKQIREWWTTWPMANIAVATGVISGIVAIDIDVRSGGIETWENLISTYGAIPSTPTQSTGGGGYHYIFTTKIKITGRNGALSGIDIKSDGGYIIVEPAFHVLGDYVWDDFDPWDIPIAEMPIWLSEILVVKQVVVAPVVAVLLSSKEVVKIRSALNTLCADNRELWYKIGMCLHQTGAAQQAYGLWTDWSQQSEAYDAKDQRRVWNSFKSKDDGLDIESVYYHAKLNGWIDPADNENATSLLKGMMAKRTAAETTDDDVQVLIDAANRPPPKYETFDAPTRQITPIPVPTLNLTAQWITQRWPYTNQNATIQAVLSMASCIASRAYITDKALPLHLYMGVVSEAVSSARYACEALEKIMEAAGLRRMIRGQRLASPSALYATLYRSPSTLYATAEYGQMLQFSRRQPSGLLEQTLSILAGIYDRNVIHLDSAQEAGIPKGIRMEDQPLIFSPALSLFALLSNDQMVGALRKGEIGRGALDQMIFVFLEQCYFIEQSPVISKVPTALIETIRLIRGLPILDGLDYTLQTIFSSDISKDGAAIDPPKTPVQFDCQLFHYNQMLRDIIGDNHQFIPLVIGAQKNLQRLAATLAVWRNHREPVVTDDLAAWTANYMACHLEALIEKIQIFGTDDGRQDVYQKVMEIIHAKGKEGISKGVLTQQSWAFKKMSAEKRDDLISILLSDGEIIEMKTERSKKFVSTRFVKEKGSK